MRPAMTALRPIWLALCCLVLAASGCKCGTGPIDTLHGELSIVYAEDGMPLDRLIVVPVSSDHAR